MPRCSHLKPGGQLESVEFDWTPRRDESRPIHPDSPVLRYWHLLQHATQSIGKPIAYRADMQTLLVGAGYDIMKHSTVTIATAENHRNFDDDHPYNELARMYQFTMFGHSLLNIDIASVENDEAKLRRYLDMDKSSFDGIQSMSMALFTQYLGHSLASFQKLCQDFQKTVRKRDSPFYHFLTGTSPSHKSDRPDFPVHDDATVIPIHMHDMIPRAAPAPTEPPQRARHESERHMPLNTPPPQFEGQPQRTRHVRAPLTPAGRRDATRSVPGVSTKRPVEHAPMSSGRQEHDGFSVTQPIPGSHQLGGTTRGP
nr:hypothetical protein CFP56_08106 [Quercus suber]